MSVARRGCPCLLAVLVLLLTGLAHSHPLGNNTVNRAALIRVAPETVSIRYLQDLAEIPTLLAAQEADTDDDGAASPAEWAAYARRRGEDARAGIELSADGRPLSLDLVTTRWRLSPGEAGLDTLRLETRLGTALPAGAPARLDYRDRRRPDEAGWKEVVVTAGPGMRLVGSDAPRISPSRELTAYPPPEAAVPGLLSAHLEARAVAAEATVTAGAPPPRQPATSLSDPSGESLPTGHLEEPQIRRSRADGNPEISTTWIPAFAGMTGYSSSPTTESTPAVALAPANPPGGTASAGFLAFFRLGVHHIATGWDHLVFLLGLVAAQKSLRRLAWVITAFTLAHSLTLGLAASGLVAPPGAWVEPAIALTIAYVGLANLVGGLNHGLAVAFAFGLIHGLGFAGALAESLQGSLGQGPGWLLDLAAFNLGIEAFQLALVLLLLPIIHVGRRLNWSAPARRATSLGALGFGLGWLFARI